MKRVLIDTSVIIESIRLKDKSETSIVRLLQKEFKLSASIITYFETYAGKSVWEKPDARKTIETLWLGIKVIDLDAAVAQLGGELRARHNLGALDALIAATALKHNLPLMTINIKDFKAVPGLNLYKDWKDLADN